MEHARRKRADDTRPEKQCPPFPIVLFQTIAGIERVTKKKNIAESYPLRNPTTSFLTAAKLTYAIGAGITAAAGTRLALQLFLVGRGI